MRYDKVCLTDDTGMKADPNVNRLGCRAFHSEIPDVCIVCIVHLDGRKTELWLADLHPQIPGPILAQADFQRKINMLKMRRGRAVRLR